MEQATSPNRGHMDLEALGARVEGLMAKYAVPGVAVGVVEGDTELALGFGETNVRYPLPVDGDTLFQIGSITKTYTATAVLRLVEQGILDLHAPAQRYLPELRLSDAELTAHLTLDHLLTHSGGLPDLILDTGRGDDALARFVEEMANLPQQAPAGERWSYSNAGYSLIGRIIEKATGGAFEDAIAGLVLIPLGMQRSFFFAEDAVIYSVAAGHNTTPGGPEVASPWAVTRSARPAGGLISSARDQLRFMRFYLGDGTTSEGTRILSRESMELLRHPRYPAGWMGDAVTLGWYMMEADGVRGFGHGGMTNGQQSTLLVFPSNGFGLVVLTNCDQGVEALFRIGAWLLDHYLQVGPPPAWGRIYSFFTGRSLQVE